jgi:hypothetical protein
MLFSFDNCSPVVHQIDPNSFIYQRHLRLLVILFSSAWYIYFALFLSIVPMCILTSHRMIQMFLIVIIALVVFFFFSSSSCFFHRHVEQELIKPNTIIVSTYLLLLFFYIRMSAFFFQQLYLRSYILKKTMHVNTHNTNA